MMKWLVVALTLAACNEKLDQRLALVDEPRLLAIVSEPAEVVPGAMVMYRALVGGPDGTIDAAPAWAFCRAPKPPTEDNAVANGCLEVDVVELGSGSTVTGTVPSDACQRFGPDTTMPGFRPRDADSTGGYYQPTRAESSDLDLVGFALTRIKCKLPTAPAAIAQEYTTRYVPNANPMSAALTIDGLETAEVTASSSVTLTASWLAESAETFLYYDPLSQTLVDRREAMRVSWFATAGTIAVDASAVSEGDLATSVSTTWRTPDIGSATLWLVLRDSRGGITTQAVDLRVR